MGFTQPEVLKIAKDGRQDISGHRQPPPPPAPRHEMFSGLSSEERTFTPASRRQRNLHRRGDIGSGFGGGIGSCLNVGGHVNKDQE